MSVLLRKKLNKKIQNLTIIFLIILFLYLNTNFITDYYDLYFNHELTLSELVQKKTETTLSSACYCKQEERLTITKDDQFYNTSLKFNEKYASQFSKSVSRNIFEANYFSCNVYNSLRRGKHQKIIALTQFKLKQISIFMKKAKEIYPDWIVRVYYDETNTIKLSDRCYLECLKDVESGLYYDNIDFCSFRSKNKKSIRFLPILDNYVDCLMYRSIDNLNISPFEISSMESLANSSVLLAGILTEI